MDYRVLGPIEVADEGASLPLGPPKQRALLALLLIHANEVLAVDRIIDAIWGEEPPGGGAKTLQVHMVGLRKALEPDRASGSEPERLITAASGYVLRVADSELDADRFERNVAEASTLLDTNPGQAVEDLRGALQAWRGRAYEDVAYEPFAQAEIRRLEELRLNAFESMIDAELRLGRHTAVVSTLTSLVDQNPYREGMWGQLMLALYRSNRQAEALSTYRRAQAALVEELGIDPSLKLRVLEQRILEQDPALLDHQLPDAAEKLRGYELLDPIGEGASGITYLAFQRSVGREVAIKAIKPDVADVAAFVRRFEAEARLVARLEHPSIVPLFDFWREPGGAYLVMPYLRGGNVYDAIAEGPWPTEDTVRLLGQVGAALAYAHRQGIVHRDIHPGNVLLDDEGNAYLADFGIAFDLDEGAAVSGRSSTSFASPEQRRGQPATPQSDIYALGRLGYHLLTGEAPNEGSPRIRELRPEVSPQLEEVLERASAKDNLDRYATVDACLDELRAAAGVAAREHLVVRNPYKGLRPFTEGDTPDFFGRDSEVSELLDTIHRHRLVGVVGPSGCGKSSLLWAGLVPALRAGRLSGSQDWLIAGTTPGAAPFESLESALLSVATTPAPELSRHLAADPQNAADLVAGHMQLDGELVLVVDQFEELFTLSAEAIQRDYLAVLEALATAPGGRIRVIVTLRADFLDRPLLYQSFGSLLRPGLVMMTSPSREGLAAAISLPARGVGISFEPGLEEMVAQDVVNQPGGLPLLEYALTQMFERRHGGELSLEAYQESGGVLGAVGRRAEDLYLQHDIEIRHVVRETMLRLVEVSETGADTRRRVALPELAGLGFERGILDQVLESYAASRLLTFDRDPRTRVPTVEVAHEALLSHWDRLRTWVDDRRDDLLIQRRLAAAAHEWDRADRAAEYLLPEGRLSHFESWAEATDLSLTETERMLVDASRQQADAMRRQRNRLRNRITAGFAAAALIAAVLAVAAYLGQRSAREEADINRARELTAEAFDALADDHQLSLLLAIEAAEIGQAATGAILPRTSDALHHALLAGRLEQVVPLDSALLNRAGLAVSKDGLVAVSFTGDTVELRRPDALDSPYAILGIPGDTIPEFDVLPSFAPVGDLLAVVDSSGVVHVWDFGSQQRVWSQLQRSGGPGGALFSPDGSVLITTGPRGATAWEAATGRDLWTTDLEVPLVPAFSIDGSRLAIGSTGDEDLVILDAVAGSELARTPMGDSAGSVVWTPDGSRILVGLDRGDIVVLDAETYERITTWQGHRALVTSLRLDSSGNRIASTSSDGTIRLWDLATHEELMVLTGHSGPVLGSGFLPNGSHLVSVGADRALAVHDVSAAGLGEVFAFHPSGEIQGIGFHPDGNSLVVHSIGGTFDPGGITIWDVNARSEGLRLDGLNWFAFGGVAFSPDGAAFAVQDWDESVAAEHPEQARLFVGPAWGPIQLRDTSTGELLRPLEGSADVERQALAFSGDGSMLASGSSGSFDEEAPPPTASVYETATGALLHRFDHGAWGVTGVAFSPDGTRLATATCGDGLVSLWNLSEERVEWQEEFPGCASRVAFSPAGDFVVAANVFSASKVWDARTGEPRFEIVGHGGGSWSVDVSPDGSKIVAAADDGSVVVVDSGAGRLLSEISLGDAAVGDVKFSPDGQHVAAATLDGSAFVLTLDPDELVELAQRRLLRSFTESECAAYRIDPCPAGL